MERLTGEEIRQRFNENRGDIEKVFEEHPAVELAYLFGSMTGKVSSLSDIDLGVYLKESLGEKEYTDVKMELLNDLIKLLGDEIDLVVMNEAPTLLNYNIVKGEILYRDSKSEQIEFETSLMQEYLDMKYYRERHVEQSLERYVECGLS